MLVCAGFLIFSVTDSDLCGNTGNMLPVVYWCSKVVSRRIREMAKQLKVMQIVIELSCNFANFRSLSGNVNVRFNIFGEF